MIFLKHDAFHYVGHILMALDWFSKTDFRRIGLG